MRKQTHQNDSPYKFPIRVPHTSDFASLALWEQKAWEVFITHISAIKNTRELKSTLNMCITPHERSIILRRVATINRILEGKSYREIARGLWCTQQTISTLRKALSETNYRSYYERGKTERKKKVYSIVQTSSKKRKPMRIKRTKYGKISINA